jgi:hypothetical protein
VTAGMLYTVEGDPPDAKMFGILALRYVAGVPKKDPTSGPQGFAARLARTDPNRKEQLAVASKLSHATRN